MKELNAFFAVDMGARRKSMKVSTTCSPAVIGNSEELALRNLPTAWPLKSGSNAACSDSSLVVRSSLKATAIIATAISITTMATMG